MADIKYAEVDINPQVGTSYLPGPVLAERERCAKIAEVYMQAADRGFDSNTALAIVIDIRSGACRPLLTKQQQDELTPILADMLLLYFGRPDETI